MNRKISIVLLQKEVTIYILKDLRGFFLHKSIIMTGHICEAPSLQQTTTWVTWFLYKLSYKSQLCSDHSKFSS